MKTVVTIVLVGWAVAASAQMKILDDFSSDSSASYNKAITYGSGTADYARNGADQFEPTWTGEATVLGTG